MNCPDAFTALAVRQAFQRERACERADPRESPKRQACNRLATLGDGKHKGRQTWSSCRREREKEGEGRRRRIGATGEREERRELVIAYYFWACKETSGGEGTREGSLHDFGSPLLRRPRRGRRFAESFPVFLTGSRDFPGAFDAKREIKGALSGASSSGMHTPKSLVEINVALNICICIVSRDGKVIKKYLPWKDSIILNDSVVWWKCSHNHQTFRLRQLNLYHILTFHNHIDRNVRDILIENI